MQPTIWLVECDALIADRIVDRKVTQGDVAVLNEAEWREQIPSVPAGPWLVNLGDQKLPEDIAPLAIRLPEEKWEAPDFFGIGARRFVSWRFREAVGAMPDVVEYGRISLASGGPQSVAQDYRILRVLSSQPVMDLERSTYARRSHTRRDGRTFHWIADVDAYVPRADLVPETDIFWDRVFLVTLIAVDALAERVMQAGCTGIRFQDPTTRGVLNGVIRYRTATGVAEEVLG